MYINSLACVEVKGGESECFWIDSGVKRGCIKFPCLSNLYMDAIMKEIKWGMGRSGVRFQEDGREWRLPGLLYTDDLVLFGKSEEDLRALVGRFAEVYKRRDLKFNAD